MADIFEYAILTHARHTRAVQELEAFADAQGLPLGQIVNSSSLASCLPMAVDGMGIALLPRQLVRTALAEGRLVALDCDWTPGALETFARYNPDRVPRFVTLASVLAAEVAAGLKDHES
jgi:DNA-binding transcriptional LysR family regulator